MEQGQLIQLHEFYKNYLFNNCLPFWLKNSVDHEYGGFLTCVDRDGELYNTDKSVWFQGRGTWMFSRLYNIVEHRQEWLDTAKNGYDFLIRNCFDTDDRMFFSVTRDGRPLRKRRYYFSECFAIIACAEYSRATGDKGALEKAVQTFQMVLDLYRNPQKLEPKVNPETRTAKSHSQPMILLSVIQILREIDNKPEYDIIADELMDTLFKDFIKPDEKALFETVGLNGERLDSPQGRCINPGHSIETAWFLMHEGLYRNNTAIINKALEVLDWSLQLGWDKEYGGIYSFVDIEGKPPEQLEWDMKLWWPHTEALYAALLAHKITGKMKYEIWYNKIHQWSFNHFEDTVYGEWYGYLHRDGSVANTLKGSLWKGPFHLPRALFLCWKLLANMVNN